MTSRVGGTIVVTPNGNTLGRHRPQRGRHRPGRPGLVRLPRHRPPRPVPGRAVRHQRAADAARPARLGRRLADGPGRPLGLRRPAAGPGHRLGGRGGGGFELAGWRAGCEPDRRGDRRPVAGRVPGRGRPAPGRGHGRRRAGHQLAEQARPPWSAGSTARPGPWSPTWSATAGRSAGRPAALPGRASATTSGTTLAVELRGRVLTVEVTDARLNDPVAVQRRALPPGTGGAGAVGRGRPLRPGRGRQPGRGPPLRPGPPPGPAAAGRRGGLRRPVRRRPARPGVDLGARARPGRHRDRRRAPLADPGRRPRRAPATTASVLLRDAPEGAYTVETKLTIDLGHDDVRNYQQAGLVVYLRRRPLPAAVPRGDLEHPPDRVRQGDALRRRHLLRRHGHRHRRPPVTWLRLSPPGRPGQRRARVPGRLQPRRPALDLGRGLDPARPAPRPASG